MESSWVLVCGCKSGDIGILYLFFELACDSFQIRRQWAGELEVTTRGGGKLKGGGMQELPGEAKRAAWRAVERVAGHWVPDTGQVHADLVGAAGFWTGFE